VVYTGCRDAQLYALDAATGKEKWKFDNALSWVITSPAVVEGKVYFGTSDSSLYHVVEAVNGKSILKKEDKAYLFSSPAVTNDVVFIGVLNGTLEARDRNSGELLWEFQTEKSKQNANWVLTAERRFNVPLLLRRLAGSTARVGRSAICHRRDLLVPTGGKRGRLFRQHGRFSLRAGVKRKNGERRRQNGWGKQTSNAEHRTSND
jgi:FOG: WD40-like repeat